MSSLDKLETNPALDRKGVTAVRQQLAARPILAGSRHLPFTRRHIDLQRVSAALCPASR